MSKENVHTPIYEDDINYMQLEYGEKIVLFGHLKFLNSKHQY